MPREYCSLEKCHELASQRVGRNGYYRLLCAIHASLLVTRIRKEERDRETVRFLERQSAARARYREIAKAPTRKTQNHTGKDRF